MYDIWLLDVLTGTLWRPHKGLNLVPIGSVVDRIVEPLRKSYAAPIPRDALYDNNANVAIPFRFRLINIFHVLSYHWDC